jgi:hypothetical protein
MKLRPLAAIFFALVFIPVVALAIQIQRAQLGITIIVNVTPNPLGYVTGPGATDRIVAVAHLRGAPLRVERAFEAQELHFLPVASGTVVAAVQHSLRVEAEITPNPTATLLTTDAPGTTVTLNAEAGVATAFTCVYHVSVDTAVTSWSLKHGLSTDFDTVGNTNEFLGGNVANDSYLATPRPTSTPFGVYADNGGAWNVLDTNAGSKTYCVDLTVTTPIATPQGQYSSNAIYTLYY